MNGLYIYHFTNTSSWYKQYLALKKHSPQAWQFVENGYKNLITWLSLVYNSWHAWFMKTVNFCEILAWLTVQHGAADHPSDPAVLYTDSGIHILRPHASLPRMAAVTSPWNVGTPAGANQSWLTHCLPTLTTRAIPYGLPLQLGLVLGEPM